MTCLAKKPQVQVENIKDHNICKMSSSIHNQCTVDVFQETSTCCVPGSQTTKN